VRRVDLRANEKLRRSSVHRTNMDAVVLVRSAQSPESREVKKMLPIGQELWPAMGRFPTGSIDLSDRRGLAAAVPNLVKRPIGSRREDDHALAAPGAAARDDAYIAHRQRRTAAGFDPLQSPVCKKADTAAVGRPERHTGSRGAGERPRRGRIDR